MIYFGCENSATLLVLPWGGMIVDGIGRRSKWELCSFFVEMGENDVNLSE